MKNKIRIFLFIILVPIMGACQTTKESKYEVQNIDSSMLSNYIIFTVSKSSDTVKIISKKTINKSGHGQKIVAGSKLLLTLEKINDIDAGNGVNIKISNGYFVDGKCVIKKNEKIYSTKEINDIYYISK